MKTFNRLVKDIGNVLGPTSGLDCDEVDHTELIKLMEDYHSSETDWLPYAFRDPSRNYTRNLVADTNQKSNLLVVVWVRR